jgi:hypothetical protein
MMNEGSLIKIVPVSSSDRDCAGEEIADWEVFTPYDR